MRRRFLLVVPLALLLGTSAAGMPNIVKAQVASFVFASDPRTAEPGVASEQITVQARGSGGEAVDIPQTGCLSLGSASSQGQFSSNATNWNPVSVLTMNKNTSNRNFYYKDTSAGVHVLTVKVALKPETENRSCANWPLEEWNIGWTTTQNITIGTGVQGGTSGSKTPPPSPGAIPASYVAPPEHTIFAEAGEDRIVSVGADVEFTGRAYGKKKEPLAGLVRYSWNFGDGGSSEGAAVLHRFVYPGRYAVTLQVAQETESVSDTLVVEAKPAHLRLMTLPDGALSIENLSDRDLDLSRWILSAGGSTFALREGTTILKGATVTFSPETTGLKAISGEIALLYPNGALAFRAAEGSPGVTSATIPHPVPAPTPAVLTQPPSSAPRAAKTISVAPSHTATEDIGEVPHSIEIATSSQNAAVESAGSSSWIWWLGAFAIAAGGAGSVYFARRYAKREWNIIEE